MASDEHKFNSQVWPTSGHLLNVFSCLSPLLSLSLFLSLSLSLHSLMQAFIYYRGTVHHLDKWYLCPIHTLPIFFLSLFFAANGSFLFKILSRIPELKTGHSKVEASKSQMLELFFESSPGFMAHWIRCPFLDGGLKLEIVFFNKTVIKQNICTF